MTEAVRADPFPREAPARSGRDGRTALPAHADRHAIDRPGPLDHLPPDRGRDLPEARCGSDHARLPGARSTSIDGAKRGRWSPTDRPSASQDLPSARKAQFQQHAQHPQHRRDAAPPPGGEPVAWLASQRTVQPPSAHNPATATTNGPTRPVGAGAWRRIHTHNSGQITASTAANSRRPCQQATSGRGSRANTNHIGPPKKHRAGCCSHRAVGTPESVHPRPRKRTAVAPLNLSGVDPRTTQR